MTKKKIVLGNKVKDVVTGFTGIATAKTDYLNGCQQITITGKVSDSGEVKIFDVDVKQVKYVGKGLVEAKKKKPAGGASSYREGTRSL